MSIAVPEPERPKTAAGSDSDSDDGANFDFMEEPASFRPPTPPPTVRSYTRRHYGGLGPLVGEKDVEVGLVSGHPLWGHILYPAAIAMSRFLELHANVLLRGEGAGDAQGHEGTDGKGKGRAKNVLELGAGGGLPGLVAALEGAANVVISDFPDPALVKNLEQNVAANVKPLEGQGAASTSAAGFTWGSSPSSILSYLPDGENFDLILLSDLVFNHSQHGALLDSCLDCISPRLSSSSSSSSSPSQTRPTDGGVEIPDVDLSDETLSAPAMLCFYSHHRPTEALIAADVGFLSLARAKGWTVKRVWKDKGAGPAFPEDAGDLCIRSTVHGWLLTRE